VKCILSNSVCIQIYSEFQIYSVEDDESLAKSNIEFVIPRDLADGFINNKRETYSFT